MLWMRRKGESTIQIINLHLDNYGCKFDSRIRNF